MGLRKYRVKQGVKGVHNKLGLLLPGNVIEVEESIGEQFVGTLLIYYREPVERPKPPRVRRVRRESLERRKGRQEE